jgi:hypothetical protein
MKFTIANIAHNKDMFNKHLKPSLDNLKGDFDTISMSSEKGFPAELYNQVIRQSDNRYIIFKTINHVVSFGALGLVGKDNTNKIKWSNEDFLYEFITIDCCFIIVDKQNNIFFDEDTFDELHMYAEDYSVQCLSKGLKNYSIFIKGNESRKNISHHSHTCRTIGYCWGRWGEYNNKFRLKWTKKIIK